MLSQVATHFDQQGSEIIVRFRQLAVHRTYRHVQGISYCIIADISIRQQVH